MRKAAVLGVVGAAVAIGGVVARRHVPQGWRNRKAAALNCLRGRPTIYRVHLVPPQPPPVLNFGAGNENSLIIETHLDGRSPNAPAGLWMDA